jgi:cysteine sulfinate desulfinase/cysteine desulfurase-like protein
MDVWTLVLQDEVRINGPCQGSLRLPNTLSVSIRGVFASVLLQDISTQLAASAGAACHSDNGPTISSVMQAMEVGSCCLHAAARMCICCVVRSLHVSSPKS